MCSAMSRTRQSTRCTGSFELADDEQRVRVRLLLAAAYVADPKKRRYALTLLSEIVREEPSNAEALALLGNALFS